MRALALALLLSGCREPPPPEKETPHCYRVAGGASDVCFPSQLECERRGEIAAFAKGPLAVSRCFPR